MCIYVYIHLYNPIYIHVLTFLDDDDDDNNNNINDDNNDRYQQIHR